MHVTVHPPPPRAATARVRQGGRAAPKQPPLISWAAVEWDGNKRVQQYIFADCKMCPGLRQMQASGAGGGGGLKGWLAALLLAHAAGGGLSRPLARPDSRRTRQSSSASQQLGAAGV
jgi:hypothetical protein